MAFLHHLAAFTVVGALVAEVVLFKPPLTVAQARKLQRVDSVFGASAGVLLVVGLLRVVCFEKGAGYYFSDAFFLTKFAAFLLAAVISIYPTVLFLSWGKAVKTRRAAGDVACAGAAGAAVPDVGIDGNCRDFVLCAVHGARVWVFRAVAALLTSRRSPEQGRLLPGDAASTAAPGCAALAGLRSPCWFWRRSLRRKPPARAFLARVCSIHMWGFHD